MTHGVTVTTPPLGRDQNHLHILYGDANDDGDDDDVDADADADAEDDNCGEESNKDYKSLQMRSENSGAS